MLANVFERPSAQFLKVEADSVGRNERGGGEKLHAVKTNGIRVLSNPPPPPENTCTQALNPLSLCQSLVTRSRWTRSSLYRKIDGNGRKNIYGTKKSKGRREEPLGTMSYQTRSKRSPPFWLLIGARNFFVPYIFFRPFRLSLASFICPWVSEDGQNQNGPTAWLYFSSELNFTRERVWQEKKKHS